MNNAGIVNFVPSWDTFLLCLRNFFIIQRKILILWKKYSNETNNLTPYFILLLPIQLG